MLQKLTIVIAASDPSKLDVTCSAMWDTRFDLTAMIATLCSSHSRDGNGVAGKDCDHGGVFHCDRGRIVLDDVRGEPGNRARRATKEFRLSLVPGV
jgi:hypothetical protein